MKYKIQDERERKLIDPLLDLFGIKELDATEPKDTLLSIQISFAGHSRVSFFNTEPVKELEDGWHPYPETKPEKKGKYLIAIDNFNLHLVDVLDFVGESFVAWNSSIIAWKELPKIWKE